MSEDPIHVRGLDAVEWCALLGLGETLPIELRLRVALIGSRHVAPVPALLTALEAAIGQERERIASLTSIPDVDYSWAAFLESWLAGDDDRRWASEPVRKCRQAGFLGEVPQASDKALVDVLILRASAEDGWLKDEVGLDDPISASVFDAMRIGLQDAVHERTPLLRFLVRKRSGDLSFIADREEEARAAYRAAHLLLDAECEGAIRQHYLPCVLLSRLWLEEDASVWRSWLGAMRSHYARAGSADAIESVLWRKEFELHSQQGRWLSVRGNPRYPVVPSQTSDSIHVENLSFRAGSLVDRESPSASAVAETAVRLASAAGYFTVLPEIMSLKARQSLAGGEFLDAVRLHLRSGQAEFLRSLKQADMRTMSALVAAISAQATSVREYAEIGRDSVFRTSRYAQLLSALLGDARIELSLRARLLPEMLRMLSEGKSSTFSGVDVARAAAEAVSEFVGSAGPAILEPYRERLAEACLDRLRNHDWRLNDFVCRILFSMMHIETYVRSHGVATVEAVVAYLEGLMTPGEPWPVVLPAFGILARSDVLKLVSGIPGLSSRLVFQSKRHFDGKAIVSRLHADLPIRILRILDPTSAESMSLAAQAIAETRVQSSESMPVLCRLVGRAGVGDADTLASIASAAARIISWRSDSGELAMSIASAPHLIYDIATKDLPELSLRELWLPLSELLRESVVKQRRLFLSAEQAGNRVPVANWITALLVLAARLGERAAADEIVASIAGISPWFASAVVLGRIHAKGDVAVVEVVDSGEEFYAAVPHLLARGDATSSDDVDLMLDAVLRYGPRSEDVGVLALGVVKGRRRAFDGDPKQVLLDYRWRLEALDATILDQIRPLLSTLWPTREG